MAQFACATRLAKHQLAVDHHAATHTRAEREHDEVLHALGAAVDELAIGRSIGIVGDHHRHIYVSSDESDQIDNTFEIEVRGILNATRVIIANRRCDADAFDRINAVFLHQRIDLQANISHINIGVKVFVGREVLFGHNAAVVAHQSDVGVGAANVDSYGISVHDKVVFESAKIRSFVELGRKK